MARIIVIITLCFNVALAHSQEMRYTTTLGRIVEFDRENIIPLMATGNYVIVYEHISYLIDENGNLDITYHYRIRRLTQVGAGTFALALRYRPLIGGGFWIGREDLINIFINDNQIETAFIHSPYMYFSSNGIPLEYLEEGLENYSSPPISSTHYGWHYFSIDFPASGEVDVRINYQTILTVFDGAYINYDSRPFWIPKMDRVELGITIENNYNWLFLSDVIDIDPMTSLVSQNWRIEKPRQNRIIITYAPLWFSENQRVLISFLNLFPEADNDLWPHFLLVSVRHPVHRSNWIMEEGVHIGRHHFPGRLNRPGNISRPRNISRRELGLYELVFLNNWQLRIVRNAFFARHRFMFRDETLNQIFYQSTISNRFGSFASGIPEDWFYENFSFETLSPIERRNIEIIQRLESSIGQ